MEQKISIKNLNVSIGKNHILKNISLEIPPNQITVILGPSGCGKTTLMKCLNRLIDLEENAAISGSILLDHQDILNTRSGLPEIRKKMGLLSQRPYPLPMNIFDNIAYGMRINGTRNRNVLREKVTHYLKQVNLWEEVKDRLKEPASSLSIGQQQRLCLARGLAVEPEIILADEPTSSLDPLSSAAIEKKFIQLKEDYTIVMVTHILRQAKRMADYVIFMYLGEVIECGKADQFFSDPQQEKTKEYIMGTFN
ncbi:MAG TPA: phosphate ABC transporter ATP-binding protein [Bacteroidales bacterium]|nr:phosphate ABC transporter ATP-binding protein [Bacteroidales bacterium]